MCVYVCVRVCVCMCMYLCMYVLYVCMYFSFISTQSTKHKKTRLSKVKLCKKVNSKVMTKAPLHNSVANQGAGPESAYFGNLVSR